MSVRISLLDLDNEELPNTPKSAKRIDSRFYFTGHPCTNGHLTKRYTSNGKCWGCRHDQLNSRSDAQRLVDNEKMRLAAIRRKSVLTKGVNAIILPRQKNQKFDETHNEILQLSILQNHNCALCNEPLNHKFDIDRDEQGHMISLLHPICSWLITQEDKLKQIQDYKKIDRKLK